MSKKKNKRVPSEKRDIDHIIRRLYNLLKRHSDRIILQKLPKNVSGYYDDGTEEITIDYRKDIVPTLIHEAIHHWHPDWCERKVIKEEKRITKFLTVRQCKNILKTLAKNL